MECQHYFDNDVLFLKHFIKRCPFNIWGRLNWLRMFAKPYGGYFCPDIREYFPIEVYILDLEKLVLESKDDGKLFDLVFDYLSNRNTPIESIIFIKLIRGYFFQVDNQLRNIVVQCTNSIYNDDMLHNFLAKDSSPYNEEIYDMISDTIRGSKVIKSPR